MWTSILVLLVILQCTFASNENCDPDVCFKTVPPLRIPKTEKDLEEICQNILPVISCLKELVDRCTLESVVLLDVNKEQLPALLEYGETLCNSDTELHKGVVESLGCIHDVVESEHEHCGRHIHVSMQKLYALESEKRSDEVSAENSEHFKNMRCVGLSLETSCLLGQISKQCSSDMENQYTQLILSSPLPKLFCDQERRSYLLTTFEQLELDSEKKKLYTEFVEKLQKI